MSCFPKNSYLLTATCNGIWLYSFYKCAVQIVKLNMQNNKNVKLYSLEIGLS